jgi:hypothetical protein
MTGQEQIRGRANLFQFQQVNHQNSGPHQLHEVTSSRLYVPPHDAIPVIVPIGHQPQNNQNQRTRVAAEVLVCQQRKAF